MANTNNNDFDLKASLEFLVTTFKVERYVYLVAVILSLIFMAILLQVVFKNPSLENIIAVFGPTGLITFTSSRILKMWTDCTEIIRLHISNGQSKKVKSDE